MKNEEKKEEDMGTDFSLAKDYSLLQKVECDDNVDALQNKVQPHNVFTIDNSPRNSECAKINDNINENDEHKQFEKTDDKNIEEQLKS